MADDTYPSGMSKAEISSRLSTLHADWRIQECLTATKAGKRADVGLLVHSTRQFYDGGGKAVVAGFAPGFVHDLASPDIPLTAKQAAVKQASPKGFAAGMVVDLNKVGPIDVFLAGILTELGPVEITPSLTQTLTRSMSFVRADQTSLKKVNDPEMDGTGTTICVIDMGCDFAHRNFRSIDEAMTTRLKFVTVMAGDGTGTVHSTSQINTWLGQANPYATYDPHAAGYNCVPVADDDGTHGTMVLDIAGGNGGGTGIKGAAPKADLAFVQVYVSETNGRRYVDGISVKNAITKAVSELVAPYVVSASLGTNDGPHDKGLYGMAATWTSLIDALFPDSATGRALVWSAGNQGISDAHLTGKFKNANAATWDIQLPKGEQFGSEFKIWFVKPAGVTTTTVKVKLQEYKDQPNTYNPTWQTSSPFVDEGNREAGTFATMTQYGSGADNLYYITCTLKPYARRGVTDPNRWETWRFELSTSQSANDIPIHIWLDRDARDGARFLQVKDTFNTKIEPQCSLSATAAGLDNATIVGAVTPGGFIAGKPIFGPGQGDAVGFSSLGPTRDNRQRPDVSAPGDAIRGARSKGDPVGSKTGFGPVATIAMGGTSMAAPHVAGLVALRFDKLRRAGTAYPASSGVRLLLRRVARAPMADGTASWDSQRGCGCADATLILNAP
jgi:subtilisin family serine protease